MTQQQRKNLEKMGGRVTTVEEFLGLTPQEMWLIDLKLDLGKAIAERRDARGWTRDQLAAALQITPDTMIALEAGGPDITVDEQLLALKTLEITRAQLRESLEERVASDLVVA